MRSQRLDITVPANGDYYEGWQLCDDCGSPINLATIGLFMYIRKVSGQGSVLQTASITKDEVSRGEFSVRINGTSLAFVLGGLSEVATLTYDLKIQYSDGVTAIPVFGTIYLTPGATY